MTIILLFYEFFKIGLFAIGGGLAILPFLYNLATKYPSWLDANSLTDMIAISESTPGPIGINVATFVGFNVGANLQNNIQASILTAIVSTSALVLPSAIIIIMIAKFLKRFNENSYVRAALLGLKPAVLALISVSCFEILKISIFNIDKFKQTNNIFDLIDLKCCVLFIFLLFLKKLNKHPIFYVAFAAIIGVLFKF